MVGESLLVVWWGVPHLAGSRASFLVFSISPAVLLRILAMFRVAKVLKSLLLTLGRPCPEPLRALLAAFLAVWRLGGVPFGR